MSVTGEGSTADGGAEQGVGDESLSPVEQALLEAAIGFYEAAQGVIELTGDARPQLRGDAEGFKAIQRAMGALEERVAAAHATGLSAERIAQVARMERETIDVILQRRGAAPSADER